jgi:hypothetical protein
VAQASLTEQSHGWYRDSDVTAWERSVRGASQWTPQMRRLRTTLLRMVARGHVGAARAVPHELLWRALPESHGPALRDDLQRLLVAGLLLAGEAEDDRGAPLAINPAMLAEVENLVNRDVTPFWSGALGAGVALADEDA